jgi:hypothetical protein
MTGILLAVPLHNFVQDSALLKQQATYLQRVELDTEESIIFQQPETEQLSLGNATTTA